MKNRPVYMQLRMAQQKNASEIVNSGDGPSTDVFYLNAVTNICDNGKPWHVNIPINGSNVQFKVDTGADVTVLSKKSYDLLPDKPTLNKTNIILKSVNSNVTVHGYFVLNTFYCDNAYNMNCCVANYHSNLLSRGAVKQMVILGAVTSDKLGVVRGSPAVIRLRDDVKPTCIKTANRIPFPMLEKVDMEIDHMLNAGIIRPITQPTEWCSTLVPIEKKSGQVRLCVDLRAVNRAVPREPYPIPSFEELTSKFNGATVFNSRCPQRLSPNSVRQGL